MRPLIGHNCEKQWIAGQNTPFVLVKTWCILMTDFSIRKSSRRASAADTAEGEDGTIFTINDKEKEIASILTRLDTLLPDTEAAKHRAAADVAEQAAVNAAAAADAAAAVVNAAAAADAAAAAAAAAIVGEDVEENEDVEMAVENVVLPSVSGAAVNAAAVALQPSPPSHPMPRRNSRSPNRRKRTRR